MPGGYHDHNKMDEVTEKPRAHTNMTQALNVSPAAQHILTHTTHTECRVHVRIVNRGKVRALVFDITCHNEHTFTSEQALRSVQVKPCA